MLGSQVEGCVEGFLVCSCLIGSWKSKTRPKGLVGLVKFCWFGVCYYRLRVLLLDCGSGVSLSAIIGLWIGDKPECCCWLVDRG